MKNIIKFMGIIGFISLRKSELYYKVIESLSKEKILTEQDKEKIKQHIANMKNESFLSKEEKTNKKIDVNLSIENLDINFDSIKNIFI